MAISNNALRNTLTILLAGGQGERLYPLTRDRSKPSVPFGGGYRIVDFALSNCLHSGLRKIHVLSQYKSLSLDRHLRLAWNIFNPDIGEYINNIPPQQRLRNSWYQGTADAVYQNIYTLEQAKPGYVLILSGDHIYTMDYRRMLEFHIKKKADLTIGGIEVAREEATPFGVLIKDLQDRITGFQEKPANPKPIPENPDRSLVSMGIYIFNTQTLVRRVVEDAKTASKHDFGKDVIPQMVKKKDNVFVYSYRKRGGRFAYWRDIGTIDAYWSANMDLLETAPQLNLDKKNWTIHTYYRHLPPTRVADGSQIKNAMLCHGCRVKKSLVEHSILAPNVRVGQGAEICDSIIMDDVEIGTGAKIRKAIIDKRVKVPRGMSVGENPVEDRKLFTVIPSGITVVPQDMPL